MSPTLSSRAPKTSYPTWEYDLIRALGGKPNPVNLEALNIWARTEAMPAAANNWLAITDPGGEFGKTGSAQGVNQYGQPGNAIAPGVWNNLGGQPGVVTFTSESAGVAATADFMRHGYQNIINELTSPSATLASIAQAILSSATWHADGAAILAQSGANSDPTIWTGGSTTGPNGSQPGQGVKNPAKCNSANVIIGGGAGFLKFNLLNECQAKAVLAGLAIGLGGALLVGGVVFMMKDVLVGNTLKGLGSDLFSSPWRAAQGEQGSGPSTTEAPLFDETAAARKRWEKVHGMPWEQSPAGRRLSA